MCTHCRWLSSTLFPGFESHGGGRVSVIGRQPQNSADQDSHGCDRQTRPRPGRVDRCTSRNGDRTQTPTPGPRTATAHRPHPQAPPPPAPRRPLHPLQRRLGHRAALALSPPCLPRLDRRDIRSAPTPVRVCAALTVLAHSVGSQLRSRSSLPSSGTARWPRIRAYKAFLKSLSTGYGRVPLYRSCSLMQTVKPQSMVTPETLGIFIHGSFFLLPNG